MGPLVGAIARHIAYAAFLTTIGSRHHAVFSKLWERLL
jgi:hypothetical protein